MDLTTFGRSREVNFQPINFKLFFNIILRGVMGFAFIASNYV